MNNAELTAKLQSHTPYLLTAKGATMSETPWHIGEATSAAFFDKYSALVGSTQRSSGQSICDANASFIAAASTWPELLWKCYDELCGYAEMQTDYAKSRRSIYESTEAYKLSLEILIALDAAGRLGWKAWPAAMN